MSIALNGFGMGLEVQGRIRRGGRVGLRRQLLTEMRRWKHLRTSGKTNTRVGREGASSGWVLCGSAIVLYRGRRDASPTFMRTQLNPRRGMVFVAGAWDERENFGGNPVSWRRQVVLQKPIDRLLPMLLFKSIHLKPVRVSPCAYIYSSYSNSAHLS